MNRKKKKLERLEKNIKENKIKMLEKQLLVEKFEQENELVFSEEGDVIIDCNIGSLSNIYSRYDMQRSKILEPLLNEYLIEETDIVPDYYTLQLNMHVFNNTTIEEEIAARKALKMHFSFAVARSNFFWKKELRKGKWLIAFGLLCLTISTLLYKTVTIVPVSELLLIFTWFALWEATNILLFRREETKSKILNLLRLYNAKVFFVRSKVPPKSIIMGPAGSQMFARPYPPLMTELKQPTRRAAPQKPKAVQIKAKSNKATKPEQISKTKVSPSTPKTTRKKNVINENHPEILENNNYSIE